MPAHSLSTPRDDAAWFRLWGQFLRASPSYEIARRYKAGTLPADAVAPDDLEKVLAVYDDLGDVRAMSLVRWWRSVAIKQFGFEVSNPTLTRLGVISHDDDDDRLARIRSSVRDYLEEEWLDQIQPTSIIASIPIGLPKAQIMKQLSAMIGKAVAEERSQKRQFAGDKAPYKLMAAKLHYASVAKYLLCLQLRSKEPDLPNWRIGVIAKLSTTYSDQDARSKKPRYDEAGDHIALKELTSRALSRGHMIAENAARGIFPSYTKCENAMPVDYPFIHRDRFGPI